MEINEIKNVALELMDALASKKLGEVAIELEGVKIKIISKDCPKHYCTFFHK